MRVDRRGITGVVAGVAVESQYAVMWHVRRQTSNLSRVESRPEAFTS